MTESSATPARTVGSSAARMGAAAALSRLFGGVRVLVVAAVLGTTFLGDTFEAANTFPTVLFELLAAGALSAVLVPTFVEHFARKAESVAEREAGGLLGVILVGLGIVMLVGMVFAEPIARVLTSASDEATEARVDLATDLLRWFLPQLLLYAVGFLSIALLNARRVFALPAAAPIGNTIVLVSALLVFRAVAGPEAGLDLTTGEVALLGLGGTLGVAAFVAIPAVALWQSGFRLVPRWDPQDPGVRRLLGLSSWAVLQHTGGALLLGAAIILGGGVEGGVVAYRVAFYVFLAPYGILAQPVHTTVQPELAERAVKRQFADVASGVRWAVHTLGLVVFPATAGLVALSIWLTSLLAWGRADTTAGVELMAAGIAGLALGLFGYGVFRLFAAAFYALDDSRTPALVGVGSAVAGVALMAVLAGLTDGAALVFSLGVGHSAAFLGGSIVLAVVLRGRLGAGFWPSELPVILLLAAAVGGAAWFAMTAWDPTGRLLTALALACVVAPLTAVYALVVRRLSLVPAPWPPVTAP